MTEKVIEHWDNFEGILEEILERFESRYFEALDSLDDLTKVTDPKNTHVDQLIQNFPNNDVTRDYFFSKIESTNWIGPMCEAGIFANAPDTEEIGERTYWLRWPASRFLARVANKDPEAVVNTFLSVEPTDNPFFHSDLVDAALRMPAAPAAKLADLEADWMDSQQFIGVLGVADHGKLIAHLALGGEISTALKFARSFLKIVPDPKNKEGRNEDEDPEFLGLGNVLRPKTKIDHWYKEILRENMPTLIAEAANEALKLLCDLLEESISLESWDPDKAKPYDHLQIWLPDLNRNSDRSTHETKAILSVAVRDAAVQIVDKDANLLDDVLGILEEHGWEIFRRISLFILAEFHSFSFHLAHGRILNKDFLDEWGLSFEYFELTKIFFDKLSTEEQETLISWIEEGPLKIPDYYKESEEKTEEFKNVWSARASGITDAFWSDFVAAQLVGGLIMPNGRFPETLEHCRIGNAPRPHPRHCSRRRPMGRTLFPPYRSRWSRIEFRQAT